MAKIKNNLHTLRRDKDGIMIFLRMEDWPQDVPLPDGATQMVTGAGPFPVTWKIFLELDKTIEMIAGWFIVPHLSVEGTFRWYQVEMEKLGWVEVERADTLPTWAMLHYRQPEADPDTETYVVIDIRRNRYLNRTQPMIRRVTIHPWSPSKPEVSEVEVEQQDSDGARAVDEHGLGEGTPELLEKLAITMSKLLGGDGIAGFPGAYDLETGDLGDTREAP